MCFGDILPIIFFERTEMRSLIFSLEGGGRCVFTYQVSGANPGGHLGLIFWTPTTHKVQLIIVHQQSFNLH